MFNLCGTFFKFIGGLKWSEFQRDGFGLKVTFAVFVTTLARDLGGRFFFLITLFMVPVKATKWFKNLDSSMLDKTY